MIAKYEVPITVYPSLADSSARLSVADCFALFMDVAAPHASLLGCGADDLMKKDLFWLTVKSKIRIIRRPYMMENVIVSTWPKMPEETRCVRDYSITKDGKPLVLGKTLWAVMNTKTGRLHKVAELYPEGFQAIEEVAIQEPFIRFDRPFGGEEFATYLVRSTDIDFGGHMNNIAYIRAIESLFSAKEWQKMNITEMEIRYSASCYEGNELTFFKKNVDDTIQLCAHLPDGKVAVEASVK